LPGFCAEGKDYGQFVEDDGGVFYEHGIGKSRLGGERDDFGTKFFEEEFVVVVLRLGFGQVDGLAVDEGQFAVDDGGAYGSGYGG